MKLKRNLSGDKIFGASPPAVFIGSWNYPRVLAGPLVPSFSVEDTAIMDLPERWVNKSFNEILRFRLSATKDQNSKQMICVVLC